MSSSAAPPLPAGDLFAIPDDSDSDASTSELSSLAPSTPTPAAPPPPAPAAFPVPFAPRDSRLAEDAALAPTRHAPPARLAPATDRSQPAPLAAATTAATTTTTTTDVADHGLAGHGRPQDVNTVSPSSRAGDVSPPCPAAVGSAEPPRRPLGASASARVAGAQAINDEEDDDDEGDGGDDDSRTPPAFTPSPSYRDAPRPFSTQSGDWCVICFENPCNTTLEPCNHSNLCDACVSRLSKRRCPTCRARAKRVRIYGVQETAAESPGAAVDAATDLDAVVRMAAGDARNGSDQDENEARAAALAQKFVVKTVKQLIAERRLRESRTLEDTLQVVFVGPGEVGKQRLVRKLLAKFPLVPGSRPPDEDTDVHGTGADFAPNARVSNVPVRLSVLRRATLTSRRMLLDDIRILRPDIIVMCASAHVGPSFSDMLSWDKLLRANVTVPRVWALLTHPDINADPRSAVRARAVPELNHSLDLPGSINCIFPAAARPRAHYICSTDDSFSIGLRSLSKDIVSYGRAARDEALAAAVAQAEALGGADAEAVAQQANALHETTSFGDHSVTASSDGSSTPRSRSAMRSGTDPVPIPLPSMFGGRQGTMHRLTLWGGARESAREVNQSIAGLVNWFTGSPA